jgi:hypothetical protein
MSKDPSVNHASDALQYRRGIPALHIDLLSFVSSSIDHEILSNWRLGKMLIGHEGQNQLIAKLLFANTTVLFHLCDCLNEYIYFLSPLRKTISGCESSFMQVSSNQEHSTSTWTSASNLNIDLEVGRYAAHLSKS